MSTRTEQAGQATSTRTQPLVKISEMDHIVLRVKDVEVSLDFYTRLLGLIPERVEQWRAAEVRFPSVRLNDDTIIDLFAHDQAPIGREGARNQDHFCMVIEPTDMGTLKAQFEDLGVGFKPAPANDGAPTATASPSTYTTQTTTWWNCVTTKSNRQSSWTIKKSGGRRPPLFFGSTAVNSPAQPVPADR